MVSADADSITMPNDINLKLNYYVRLVKRTLSISVKFVYTKKSIF